MTFSLGSLHVPAAAALLLSPL
jgi:hypothetical protein